MRCPERSDRRRLAAGSRRATDRAECKRSGAGPEQARGGGRRATALVVNRRMERSDRRRPWFRQRGGSIMVMAVDKEGEDIV